MHAVILGAGPAGLSCANALHSFGLAAVVIENRAEIGGAQRANFHPNLWLLGAPPDEPGHVMTARMATHFASLPIAVYRQTELVAVRRVTSGFEIDLLTPDEPLTLVAPALVIATGTRPRSTAALTALAEQSPAVHLGALTEAERDCYHDRRVLILGGGDNAFDHARLLAEQGCAVSLCARGRFNARPHFIAECAAFDRVQLHEHCVVSGLTATAHGISADLGHGVECFDGLICLWGYQPNSEITQRFAPELRPHHLPAGHIDTDRWQRTSVPSIYAIGDVTDTPQPSVAVAVAHGLTAARAIERHRRTSP
ncbi:MAG: NAD(P)/FAD-dependent oxidoreductase [Betaproteobacteria bacterium]|nr:MAG: NAD(P)/FAD-dependent oxidoreductase [Betaproteobacteria bacterium]